MEQVLENVKEGPCHRMSLKKTHDLRDHGKVKFSEGQDDANICNPIYKYNEDAQLLQKPSSISSDDPCSRKRKLFDEIEDHDNHILLSQYETTLRKDHKSCKEELIVPHRTESVVPPFQDSADVMHCFSLVLAEIAI